MFFTPKRYQFSKYLLSHVFLLNTLKGSAKAAALRATKTAFLTLKGTLHTAGVTEI